MKPAVAVPSSVLYVSNIPVEAPESMVRDIFIICGSISRVQIGRPEGFAPKTTHAIVSYERVQDANVAFGALAGFPLMGLRSCWFGAKIRVVEKRLIIRDSTHRWKTGNTTL